MFYECLLTDVSLTDSLLSLIPFIDRLAALDVKVEVVSTVMIENKIPDEVRAL